jgi:uncharacterized repeat protein (TIGR01451 family)
MKQPSFGGGGYAGPVGRGARVGGRKVSHCSVAFRAALGLLLALLLSSILLPAALAKHTSGEVIFFKLFVSGKEVTKDGQSFTVNRGQPVSVKLCFRYYRRASHGKDKLTYDLNLYDDSRWAGWKHLKTIVNDDKEVPKGAGNQNVCHHLILVPSQVASGKYMELYGHLEVDDDSVWDSNERTKKATIWVDQKTFQVRLIGRIVQKGNTTRGVQGVKVSIDKVHFDSGAVRGSLTATTDKYGLFAVTLNTSRNPVELKGYEASFTHNGTRYTISRSQTTAQVQYNVQTLLNTVYGIPTNAKEWALIVASVLTGLNIPPAVTSVNFAAPMSWTTKPVEVDVSGSSAQEEEPQRTAVPEEIAEPGPAFDLSYVLSSPSEALPGEEVTYFIVLVNSGEEDAETVCASVTLPDQLTLLPESVLGDPDEEAWTVDGATLERCVSVSAGEERTLCFTARLADTVEADEESVPLQVDLTYRERG